jgi:hypothetical protein
MTDDGDDGSVSVPGKLRDITRGADLKEVAAGLEPFLAEARRLAKEGEWMRHQQKMAPYSAGSKLFGGGLRNIA